MGRAGDLRSYFADAISGERVCCFDCGMEVRRALRELIKGHAKTDAAFCGSDIIAAGALLETQTSGVRVPKQFAVAGFADMELAAQMTPSLTTASIAGYRIGTLAAEMLLERIGGSKPPERVLDTCFRIIERESA